MSAADTIDDPAHVKVCAGLARLQWEETSGGDTLRVAAVGFC